jgi:hypothetical protein
MQFQITSCSLRFSLSLPLCSQTSSSQAPGSKPQKWNLEPLLLRPRVQIPLPQRNLRNRESRESFQTTTTIWYRRNRANSSSSSSDESPLHVQAPPLGYHFPSPRSPEPRSAIFYSCVRTTKWRESRQSRGRRRRKRKEGNNDTQEEEEEEGAEEMLALPPHLAYLLLSISAHKSSDAKRSSYFPCSFLLLLVRRRVSLLFVSSRLCRNLLRRSHLDPGDPTRRAET